MNTDPVVWDSTVKRLVAYTERARYETLAPGVVHEARRHLIDTFASALGAYDEPVSVMARAVAGRYRSDDMARVWGCGIMTTPEMAAFANGVMTRTLDVSDTYLGRSRGHPSDMVSGLVAVAESVHADGKSLIAAVALAYDVYCSFCKSVDINSGGWDQPVYTVLGCVLGAAKLMRLTADETGHALALALTPNLALAQARRGSLSSWKGCAGANASRNAVFAAVLAKEGFTGPGEIFEGSGGFWDAVGRADWPLPDAPMIGETRTKFLPVCYHGQSAVFAALDLRDRVDVRQIEEIKVDGYQVAVFMMGNDASRWAPTTRETADHSLPYCVAIALLDGKLVRDSFADARLRDPAVAELMHKVRVAEDPALTALYPESAPGRVTIRMRSGETQVAEIRYPRGHEKSPMSDAEIESKFCDLAAGALGAQGCDRALKALWQLERMEDAAAVTALLVP
ncbi:MAG: putative 2-methylcitrate dehydratase PrpD [Proteobacteria bacterium]|nr:putative 2-methylcitrate dehydratase PrpD [Pseudomonadota bacterium]